MWIPILLVGGAAWWLLTRINPPTPPVTLASGQVYLLTLVTSSSLNLEQVASILSSNGWSPGEVVSSLPNGVAVSAARTGPTFTASIPFPIGALAVTGVGGA